jgi:alpha-D-ribose 1-methylphosphonate 5-triphosphate synthase subunit PhnG
MLLSMNLTYDDDLVLAECDLERLKRFVEELETRHTVEPVRDPGVCLTLVKAEDSLEKQPFYLGEALTTECEVSVDGQLGIGLCLGEEPVRGYCIAVFDALRNGADGLPTEAEMFIERERAALIEADTEEFNQVLRTRVDFKLMEQD